MSISLRVTGISGGETDISRGETPVSQRETRISRREIIRIKFRAICTINFSVLHNKKQGVLSVLRLVLNVI